jgi:predicted MFS family arabinose efflux permease
MQYVAVAVAGATAFLDMYATQPLLPALRVDFRASEAAVAATISSLTFAVAIAAPFIGPLVDAIGRKRVIVTAIFALAIVTLFASRASTLGELVAWRFVQGLIMPGIFATTVAYIAEEFPPGVLGRASGVYVGGNVLGGFLGRYVGSLVAAHATWHEAFLVLGAMNVAGGLVVLALLPRAQHFERKTSARAALAAIGRFLRDPTMLATFAVGSSILFAQVAALTFATFYLAGAPFKLDTIAIGDVFFVYLVGAVATPISGRLVDRFGNRFTSVLALCASATGMLITLAPSLPIVIAGIGLMTTGVFVAQASSQGYVGRIAGGNRSSAAALYLTFYYAGGGLGAVIPAHAWATGGWPATVATIVVVQFGAALVARLLWKGSVPVVGKARVTSATARTARPR